jgi:cytochrome c-type biogenesis protein
VPTQEVVLTGSLLLAIPVSMAAGLVSFLSPCVLPLVPGYLSYVTGLTGADLAEEAASRPTPPAPSPAGEPGTVATAPATAPVVPHRTSRVLTGSVLFVLGFSLVFVSYGTLIGWLGDVFFEYGNVISRVAGVLVIALGLSFLGLIPGMQREWRVHRTPQIGVWSAPLLGVLFGIGWSPCIGPTIAAVQSLALTEASAARGALLSFAYCIGLGLPFILVGLLFRRAMGAIGWVRQHTVVITRIGGGMLVLIGVLLVTGVWQRIAIELTSWAAGVSTVL